MPTNNELFSRFWALQPESVSGFFEGMLEAFRYDASKDHPALRAFSGAADSRTPGYENKGGVAVIRIHGGISRESVISWSGRKIAQGQDEIAAALESALRDPAVRAILLDVNSPGGCVSGTKELADAISLAAAQKPMAAYANGLMASAAMWLSAAAGRVFAPATATVGSVGVIMVHTDFSKLNERWGVSYSYITGGKYKAAGNEDNPLSDEARALFQKQVTEIHEIFKADVVRGLNITAPAEHWAEGQTMLAGEAKALGMVTEIVRDLNSAITLLRQEATMDLKTFAAQHPDLLAEIQNAARTEAEQAMQAKAGEAAKAAHESTLAVVKAVAGEEVVATVSGLLEAGISTPAQIAAVSGLLAKAAKSPAAQASPPLTAEEKAKAAILAGINAATPPPVHGAAPDKGDEAETRAAIERMSKL